MTTSGLKSIAVLEGAAQTALVSGDAKGLGAGDFVISAVPEPASAWMALGGMALLAAALRRRRG